MKFFLISDNTDTLAGMRLVGIEGVVVHKQEEFISALNDVSSDPDVGILLITEKLSSLAPDEVHRMKLESRRPLLVEIPDRHANSRITSDMESFISGAIGINL